MVHNGIEYGMMAAYAEGLNILRHANVGTAEREDDAETAPLRDPEYYQYDIDIAEVAEVWRRGSVVSSWLLDLTARRAGERSRAWRASAGACATRARAGGRCRPRSTKACRPRCCRRPCSTGSRRRATAEFANKVLSAMRKEFGGHDEKAST